MMPGIPVQSSVRKAVVLSIDAIASPEFSQAGLLFRGSRRKSSRDAGQSLNSLYTSLSLEPQSFDAGSEGRGLHAEQFRRTPWAKDLAAGLLECCSDAVAFLALQFVACQQSRFWQRVREGQRSIDCHRLGQLKTQQTVLREDDSA